MDLGSSGAMSSGKPHTLTHFVVPAIAWGFERLDDQHDGRERPLATTWVLEPEDSERWGEKIGRIGWSKQNRLVYEFKEYVSPTLRAGCVL